MKKRILIVDDDSSLTQILSEVLSATGRYEVQTCDDPQDAFREVADHPYDLVISDWQMPSMDGDMLILCLRAEWQKNPTPRPQPRMLMMSGAADSTALKSRAEFVGNVSCIRKPFAAGAFLDKVTCTLNPRPRNLMDQTLKALDTLEHLTARR